jgi:PhzF family phenazine biosynthesis protein
MAERNQFRGPDLGSGNIGSMAVPIYVVDAFTSRAFTGNPAGVCLLKKPAEAAWMQSVAAEMRHAETAFITPVQNGHNLRWFTPTVEVDLCGHATLAAAHVLWQVGHLAQDDPAVFHTKSGDLTCTRHGYGIQMDFPAELAGPSKVSAETVQSMLCLSAPAQFIGENRMDVLVEVEDQHVLKNLEPNFEQICGLKTRGIIVTAKAIGDEYDFVSRFFAPAFGVPEDPVTGSAHCCLGPYWAEKLGRIDLVGYQCSPRGGTVRVGVRGDRVLLQGHAITTLMGEFLA